MKRSFVAALAVVATLVSIGVHPETSRAVSQDSVGVAATRAWTSILPAGDSVTRGVSVTSGQVTAGNGYRGHLWSWLFQAGVSPNFVGSCPDPASSCPQVTSPMGDYNHEGHDGWTVAQLRTVVPTSVVTYRPRAVVLLTGANDLRLNRTPAQFKADLHALVAATHVADPGVHVFLVSPTFKGDEPDWDDYVRVAHEVVTERRVNVSLVPAHTVGESPTRPGQIHWGELSDGVHPTACGYLRLAYVVRYYLELHPSVNPSGASWPNPPYPYRTATGPCAAVA